MEEKEGRVGELFLAQEEAERIRSLIREFGEIFQKTNMDVCESARGRWFFFRYDEKHNNYELFTEFHTAKELVEIVTGELAMDAAFLLDDEFDFKPYVNGDLSGFVQARPEYEECILALQKQWKLLAEFSAQTY